MLLIFIFLFNQVTNLNGVGQSGQTFLTWQEIGNSTAYYRIYISSTPITLPAHLTQRIGEVDSRSSNNPRGQFVSPQLRYFRISEGAPFLDSLTGLFVRTISQTADHYYAVTTVVGGYEDSTVVPGQNSLSSPVAESVAFPLPVRQRTDTISSRPVAWYCHWVDSVETPDVRAMANRSSISYTFGLVNPPSGPEAPFIFCLHGYGGNYANLARPLAGLTFLTVLSPDDPFVFRDTARYTFWFGYSNNFGTGIPVDSGITKKYTQNRILYYYDWMKRQFGIDTNRVYFYGSSMGGIGGIHITDLHSERFAAVLATVPKFDLSDTTHPAYPHLKNQWGNLAANPMTDDDGMPIYNRENALYVMPRRLRLDYPIWYTFCGRNDYTVGWSDKPPFYRTCDTTRHGGFHYWDMRGHGGSGYWSPIQTKILNNILRHRRNRSYPAFSNLSINDNPGNGSRYDGDSIGTFNGYITWDTAIVDLPNEYQIIVKLDSIAIEDTATVDITLRRLQNLAVYPGAEFQFDNFDLDSNQIIQSFVARVDTFGLLTIPRVRIRRNGNRLSLNGLTPVEESRTGNGCRMPNFEIFPNPGSSDFTIRLSQTPRRIIIYDVVGKVMKSFNLKSNNQPGGALIVWDGKDDRGKLVPCGIYIVEAKKDNARLTKLIIRINKE